MSPSPNVSRSITFKLDANVVIFTEDSEGSTRYTQEECAFFKRQALLDSLRLVKRQITSAPLEIGLYECVGLERYLSNSLLRRTMEARRAHINAVLEEQRFQVRNGVWDEQRLAVVSRASSDWARGRAIEVANSRMRIEE